MKEKTTQLLSKILITILSIIIISCNDTNKKIQVSTEYSKYISAYTSGVISNSSDIIIELKEELSNHEIEKLKNTKLFKFKPDIQGETSWIDNRTIRFSPSKKLDATQLYTGTFYLSQVTVVPSNMLDFKFQFQSKHLELKVEINELTSYPNQINWKKINATLYTTDYLPMNTTIEEIIEVTQNGKKLNINWQQNGNHLEYHFTVDSISRTEKKEIVKISWDGQKIGVNQKGEINYEIPPLGDFKVMQVNVSQSPNQYIEVHFSDPISKNTILDGLIYLNTQEELSWSINNNIVSLYPKKKLIGTKKLIITNTIKNTMGYQMLEDFSKDIEFLSIKPQIELIGDGVILPSTNGLIFPFKAVNLKAVNVKIIRIFEDNVSQFFQKNNFSGKSSLTRVGRVIYKDDILLKSDQNIDLENWNTFSLDLSEMIKTEPGAIYRVMLSCKMSHSLYPCDSENENNLSLEKNFDFEDRYFEKGNSYWYADENYNYGGYSYYNSSQRIDPCHIGYYASNTQTVSRNVFASDFGIIAKGSESGNTQIIVTDLKTTKPQENVNIELYNYQSQLISSKTTNIDGVVSFDIQKKAFLLIAKRGKEIGYLKLDDGSSLNMSMFNVSGATPQDGLKGYIYGDRGVWRPGDSLFISFILEDKQKTLPKNHPVNFTLLNTKGQIHDQITLTNSENGFYVFKTKTNENDQTGKWEAIVKVGDARFSKELMIETIKPNRLKVNLDFQGKILTNQKESNIELTSYWLHGAPAKELKANIEINLSETTTGFNDFPNYNFDDYIKSFKSKDLKPIELILNKKGKIQFSPKFNIQEDAPGILKASFKTRIFEKGGNSSVDRVLIPYSPYRSYVGFQMPKGTDWNKALYSDNKNLIPIATVDENGKRISRENIKIEIFEINWHWWYQTSSKYKVAQFVTGANKNLIHTEYINTKNGEAIYELDLNKEIYGRYYIRITDPVSKHTSGEVFYLSYNNYWRSSANKTEGAEMLIFDTNKKNYEVGENIKITLPNVQEGRVLISVESGNQILHTYWFKTSKNKNVFEFKVTEEMAPNIYLNLSFIQPHKYTENDLPIRMYGIKGVNIQNKNTHLNPVIKMQDELRPNEETTIQISEKNGRKMSYTIAVVDEGLLDLTHFKTPTPWNTFYAKQSLSVKTWDMYKYVSGAFSGEMAGLLQIGGDEYSKAEDKKKANRFKPVVKFLGPFTLNPEQENKHTFTMPNYIGSVRTMVVSGYNDAYGSSEKTTPVKKPLMVLSTLPRVLGPTETVTMPVTVFAMTNDVKKVEVKLTTNNKFEIIGSNTKKIKFNEPGEKIVNFKLKVKDQLGIGEIQVDCKSGKKTAFHKTEIDIRTPNPLITKVSAKVIENGESWIKNYQKFGINGTNSAILEISTIPPINLEKRLNYLIRYPHGCIEQTTSSVFPQLYLTQLMQVESKQAKEIQKNIKTALIKFQSFQTSSGGFSYWPSSSGDANEWGTNYAGHFMIEAKNKGYNLPVGLLEKWIKHQTTKANDWHMYQNIQSHYITRSSELNQAYRLYTLALAGKPALSAMNKMRSYSSLSNVSKWRLAAAYLLIGRKDVAENLIKDVSISIKDYKGSSYTYGSKIRDKSMILETLVLLKDYETGKQLLDIISNKLSSNDYMSTQTTAYSLLAISKFVNLSGKSESFSFNFNSKDFISEKSYHQIKLNVEKEKAPKIDLKNTSNNMLFASLYIKGVPMYDGSTINEDNQIKMEIEYYNMDHTQLNPEKIEQGTDFYVQTIIKNTKNVDYENLALTQIFPSGWEIRNTRMDLHEDKKASQITYQDIRDDRVYSYFDIKEKESKIITIQLNASYLGKFYLPITNCEAMYDNSINAKEGGGWTEVVEGNAE